MTTNVASTVRRAEWSIDTAHLHPTCLDRAAGTPGAFRILTETKEPGKTAFEMSAAEGFSHASHAHHLPSPPEPKTPMWLPVVGAVLFLVLGLLWSLSAPSAPAQAAPAAATSGAD